MGINRKAVGLLSLLFSVLIASSFSRVQSAEAIREMDLALSALVYDPFTGKLYGASTNSLLQIDPDSGQVLRSFDLGSRIVRLELGASNGLWAGIDHAIRRFNLETLTAEEPIPVQGEVFDLSPSQSEPYTVAFTTPRIVGRWEAAWVMKNGIVLPETSQSFFVAVIGSYVITDTGRHLIGQNGILNSSRFPLRGYSSARMKPFGEYIYWASWAGSGFDTGFGYQNIITGIGTGYPQSIGRPATIAINQPENSAYFLVDNGASWDLRRYEHITYKHTGHYRFPNYEPNSSMVDRSLVAWGTNRAAFHTSSRLYLLDTAQLFLPADLSIIQTVPPTLRLGTDYNITITITNRGPGAAVGLNYTDTLSSGIIRDINQKVYFFPSFNPTFFGNGFGPNVPITLQPGEAFDLATIKVFPTDVLTATNQFTITSYNDPNPANDTSEATTSIIGDADPVLELPFQAADIAYDPLSQRLFMSGGSSLWESMATLWAYDLKLRQIRPVTNSRHLIDRIEISETGGNVFARYSTGLPWEFDSKTLDAVSQPLVSYVPIDDFAPSPRDFNLHVFSGPGGTVLSKNLVNLPNSVPEQGNVAFSSDGTRAYLLNPLDCSLSVLRVDATGLTREIIRSNVMCGDFTVSANLLYFNNGFIYNPASGQRAANSFSLPPPSYVVPRNSSYIDVLNRTNGAWAVRRLSAATLQPIRTVPIDPAFGTPLEIIGLDPNTVAVRTLDSARVLVIDLRDRDILAPFIRASAANELTISFFSAAGKTYRIERTPDLNNPTWTTVRENILGNSSRLDEKIASPGQPTSFYRVVQL